MKYEYKFFKAYAPILEDKLNQLGDEGWELIGFSINGALYDEYIYYFKRVKQ